MDTQWYYTNQAQRLGPVSPEQLKQLVVSGRLQPSDMVWKEGMTQWAPASRVKGLFPAETLASAPEPPPPLPVTPILPEPTPAISRQQPSTARVCEWCAESIPEKAFKCPHCTKWRKDIAQDRSQVVGALVGMAMSAFVAVCVAFMGASQWVEEVGAWPLSRHYEFSINKFLTSPAGWAVIGMAFFFLFCGYASRCAEKRLGRKTGHGFFDITIHLGRDHKE